LRPCQTGREGALLIALPPAGSEGINGPESDDNHTDVVLAGGNASVSVSLPASLGRRGVRPPARYKALRLRDACLDVAAAALDQAVGVHDQDVTGLSLTRPSV
jgi:hypothetical protein